jgi:7-cyano-7-deazaguanine reductase
MRDGLGCLDASWGLFASANTHRVETAEGGCPYVILTTANYTHVAQLRARYNQRMPKSPRSTSPRYTSPRYTSEHASAGLDHDFPEIETWPNQFPGYEIVVDDPEFTSVCPKTSLPDFGNIVIRYVPDRLCLELKSLKEYLQSYRNLGIFQENVVNQVLEDVVRWAKPVWAEVKGEFRPRGGIATVVIAKWPRPKK